MSLGSYYGNTRGAPTECECGTKWVWGTEFTLGYGTCGPTWLLLQEWEPSLQALKITQEIPHELVSNAMNLGNQSPHQFFGLFTAGELNFSKTTWILGRVLFGLKSELEVG